MVAAEVDPERLVFVDEMGVHTSLAPLSTVTLVKGERVRLSVPRNRGKNTTFLAAMRPLMGWARRWPWRAPPTRKSSMLT